MQEGRDMLGIKEVMKSAEDQYDFLVSEFTGRIVAIVIAMLGLITALAWDDVLRDVFHLLFGNGDALALKLLYAGMLTIILAVVSVSLGKRYLKRTKKRIME